MKAKTWTALAVLLTALIACGAAAAEKDDFWGVLQGKLQKVTPGKKSVATTAVGGVRGARNDSPEDVYWKGREKEKPVAEEELRKFNQALETKLKGDNEKALALFEEFLSAYPQSALRIEGLQAVEKIKQESAEARAPAKAASKTRKKQPQSP